MTRWAVLATGPSMSQAVADSVRDRCKVVAVSDAWRLAPWADALASTDGAWWKAHPEAIEGFPGRRFGCILSFRPVAGVERFEGPTDINSGLLAIQVAVQLGATEVLLCGLDLHSPGDHFFGRHPAGLKSTPARRMQFFHKQFAGYRPRRVSIVNCTPGSALECYPRADLAELLVDTRVNND